MKLLKINNYISIGSILLVMTFTNNLLAQNTILLNNISRGPYCPSQEIDIAFNTSGVFSADNQFKIQLSDKTGGNFKDLGINTKSNAVKIPLPSNLEEGSGYQFRVVSTNPSVVGIPGNAISILNKPKAVLSTTIPNALKYPTNLNQPVSLNLKVSNGLPCDVVLSDSSKINLYYSEQNFEVRPTQTLIYKISKISNQCGIGEGTGSLTATVNTIGLKILGLDLNNRFCIGGNISFSYTSNGKLNDGNTFKLIISSNKNNYEKTINLSAVSGLENTLSGVLPNDLEYNNFYSIRLQTSSPSLVSSPVTINIPQKAVGDVGLYSQYTTPTITSTAYGGVPPYKITYSDGTFHSGTSNMSVPIIHYDYKKLKTTLEDQCGYISYAKDTIQVSGEPYMQLDSVPTKPFCSSETIEIAFKTNIPFTNKSKYMVRFNPTNSFNIYSGSYVVEAQRQGDKLLVKLPQTIGFYYVVVETQNPAYNSNPAQGEIEISSKGAVSLGYEDYYSFERLVFRGIFNPYSAKVKIDNNEINLNKADFVYDSDSRSYYLPLSSSKSSKYALLSATNGCGAATILSNNTINRISPKTFTKEVIMGDLPKEVYCIGDEISIPFEVNGSLNNDEVVELHVLSQDYSTFSYMIGSSKTSPLKTTLNSSSSGILRIVLKISNSAVQSESRQIKVKYKPTIYISASLPDGQPVLKGQRVPISMTSTGTFPTYYTLNGKNYIIKEKFYTWQNNSWSYNTLIFPNENQKFELTNVRNECGIGVTNQVLDIMVAPIKLFFNEYNASLMSTACINYPFSFSYKVYGQQSNTKISAQISDLNGKNFKDVNLLKAGNPMTIIFPKEVEEGSHKLRLYTTVDNQNYYSEERDIRIIKSGIATLTSPNGNNIEISGNSSVNLSATFTGTPPWSLYIPNFRNDSYQGIYDKQTTFSISPTKKTTLKILEAENTCGYNETRGEVIVSVKPGLEITGANPNKVCSNQNTEIAYNIFGDFAGDEEISFFISKSYTFSNPITVAKVKASQITGKISVKIPNTIQEGTYYIMWQINNQPLQNTYNYQTIIIDATPTATLSGSTTINPGSTTYLNLITTGSKPIQYELSDGTKGSINFNETNILAFKPTTTATYTIKSISNFCGTGTANGLAKITVNPISEKYIYTSSLTTNLACSGQNIPVSFTTKGSFSASNKFRLQISDSSGENFTTLNGIESSSSPINFNLPSNIPAGKSYRIRIISTDLNTSSEATPQSLEIAEKASVLMTPIKYAIQNLNDNVSIQFDFKGSPPWNLTVTDSLQRIYSEFLTINQTPYIHTFFPKQLYTFKVSRLTNACGLGTITGNAFIKFGLVTASEETQNWDLTVYPNPTSHQITITHPAPFEANLSIVDLNGKIIISKLLKTDNSQSIIDLDELLLPGLYLIKVDNKSKNKVWKIIKE